MKLLLIHNYYQQRGGEDVVFEAEAALLERHGHEVLRYTARNDEVGHRSSLRLAGGAIWSTTSFHDVRQLLRQERPVVVHVHNSVPLVSPAVYYAARSVGVPVVQTLHNYRLVCPSAILFRDGHVCESCLGRAIPMPGIRRACYRASRSATSVVAATSAVHRFFGTWTRAVDLYVALTTFARSKFIEGGLPARKIVVKPNFTPDPGIRATDEGYALYVGRLSPEKGIGTLLEAWRQVGSRLRLRVVGDGPARAQVAAAAQAGIGVEFEGPASPAGVTRAMAGAKFLVFPSVWYETFGLTIIEAYAVGIPVLASNLGAMSALVRHGQTGLHFRPGDPQHLAAQIDWMLSHPEEVRCMGHQARREYESLYTPERNYDLLMTMYRSVTAAGAYPPARGTEGGTKRGGV